MGALVSVARSIRLIARLVGMAACAFSLSGCYFANGIDVAPQALVRKNSDLSGGKAYVLQGQWWHTGSMHLPFDFTVYRYPVEIEVRTSGFEGDFSAGEVEFYRCGQRIVNVKGAVRVSSNTLALDLEYPWPERSRGAERLEVVAFLNDAAAPSSPCLTPK